MSIQEVNRIKNHYDATAPTGSLYGGTTYKSSGSYTNASYVKYVASDSHSGVKTCYVRKPGSSSYVTYTSGTQLTAEGTYYFYCIDNSGNQSTTVSITLDKTVPTGTLYGGTSTKSSGSYTNASYVKYTASDSLSGVNACYVKMPGASSYTSYSSGTQLATQGTYYFYCVDKAGNSSSVVSITLDTTKPTGTLYGGTSSISSGTHTKASYVKYVPSDNIALNAIYVKKPGSAASIGGGILGQTLLPELPVLGYLLGSFIGSVLAGVSFEIADRIIVSICVKSGFTCFGLVDQDYTLPEEVLDEIGIERIDLLSTIIPEVQIEEIEIETIGIEETEVDTVDICLLKRGLIGVKKVGYTLIN